MPAGELRSKPFQANRLLALLSKMLNLAEAWGLDRFLSPAELTKPGEALARSALAEAIERVLS